MSGKLTQTALQDISSSTSALQSLKCRQRLPRLAAPLSRQY